MKKLLFTLFILVLFCGCSPQKRIARIAEKYNLKQWETVMFTDTIYMPEKIYTFETLIDTAGRFYQEINGNTVIGQINSDTVYMKFTTKADTIYIEKPINIQTIKVEKPVKKNRFMTVLFLVLFTGVCGFYIKTKIQKYKLKKSE